MLPLGDKPPIHPLLDCINSLPSKGFVSKVYAKLPGRWERDFNLKDEDILWDNAWENIFLASKNPKPLTDTFQSVSHIFCMKLIPSSICTMCHHNALECCRHMMWECSSVRAFRVRVSKVLSELLGTVKTCYPILLLLNDDSQLTSSGKQRKLLLSGLTTLGTKVATTI